MRISLLESGVCFGKAEIIIVTYNKREMSEMRDIAEENKAILQKVTKDISQRTKVDCRKSYATILQH